MNRVVITGCGTINSLGKNYEQTWYSMKNGCCGISEIQSIPGDLLRVKCAAEIKNYSPDDYFDSKSLLILDKNSQYALIAAREAVKKSGLDFSSNEVKSNCAVVIGASMGGGATYEKELRRYFCDNAPRISPMAIVRIMANAPASHISIEFGTNGPAYVVSSACSSSNHAIANAYNMIRNGEAKIAITGGTDANITLGMIKAWESMNVLSTDLCRPFCLERKGLILGEGAAIFTLENYDYALARGATIYAEIIGVGLSSDAMDSTKPSEYGASLAMLRSLEHAGIENSCVDYINAHGTGTALNDFIETNAIRHVFGDYADTVGISSTKSMHGHLLGGAGAIELVACLGAISDNLIPPTINYKTADPKCNLNYTPNIAMQRPVNTVMSNSFAFGGLNAVLLLHRL